MTGRRKGFEPYNCPKRNTSHCRCPKAREVTNVAPNKHPGKKNKNANQDKHRWRKFAAWVLPALLVPVALTVGVHTVTGVGVAVFSWIVFFCYVVLMLELHVWHGVRARFRVICGVACGLVIALGAWGAYRVARIPAERPLSGLGDKGTEMVRIAMLPKILAAFNDVAFEANKPMKITVLILNNGETAASSFEAEAHIERFTGDKLPIDWNSPRKKLGQPSVATLGKGATFTIPIATEDKIDSKEFRQIRDGTRQLRLFVWGKYDDEFGSRGTPFKFCWAYNRQIKQLATCTREQTSELIPN